MNANTLAVLQEINANYSTAFETRHCAKCCTFRAHLVAHTVVPGTNQIVRRVECTSCHSGETRLMDNPEPTDKGETPQ